MQIMRKEGSSMSMHSGVSSGSSGGMIMQGGSGVVSPETSEREKSTGITNKFVYVSFASHFTHYPFFVVISQ